MKESGFFETKLNFETKPNFSRTFRIFKVPEIFMHSRSSAAGNSKSGLVFYLARFCCVVIKALVKILDIVRTPIEFSSMPFLAINST